MAPPTKEVAELPRKSMAQLKREYRPTRQERAAQERIKVRVRFIGYTGRTQACVDSVCGSSCISEG